MKKILIIIGLVFLICFSIGCNNVNGLFTIRNLKYEPALKQKEGNVIIVGSDYEPHCSFLIKGNGNDEAIFSVTYQIGAYENGEYTCSLYDTIIMKGNEEKDIKITYWRQYANSQVTFKVLKLTWA